MCYQCSLAPGEIVSGFFFKMHDHTFRKRRKHFQPTKKLGCPSKLIISRVIKFPEYKVCAMCSIYSVDIIFGVQYIYFLSELSSTPLVLPSPTIFVRH